jgi:hypothetical protein
LGITGLTATCTWTAIGHKRKPGNSTHKSLWQSGAAQLPLPAIGMDKVFNWLAS